MLSPCIIPFFIEMVLTDPVILAILDLVSASLKASSLKGSVTLNPDPPFPKKIFASFSNLP